MVPVYGLSTPHFDPWELVKLPASVGEAPGDEGIFVVGESDRRYRILPVFGYRWALAERAEGKFTMSFHAGRDFLRGTLKRIYTNLREPGPNGRRVRRW